MKNLNECRDVAERDAIRKKPNSKRIGFEMLENVNEPIECVEILQKPNESILISKYELVGTVIQANENAGEWTGCLLMIDEAKENGVRAFLDIPHEGVAYVNLTYDQIEYVGIAPLVREDMM